MPNGGVAITPVSFAGEGGGGARGGRGGMGGTGLGSVVDAGSVLIGLNSGSRLVVFEPSKEGYKALVSYKVSEGQTYECPIVSGNRIFVKDQESLTLFTVE